MTMMMAMSTTMTLSAVRTAVGRQWLSATAAAGSSSSSSSSSSRLRHHVGLLALGMITSSVTTSTVLCEDEKKGFMGRFFPKKKVEEEKIANNSITDSINNIDWSNVTLDKIQSTQFWDSLAGITGEQVQSAVDSGIPTQLSYGFVSGYCSGMAFKKIGRLAAGVFGTYSISYNFYIY
jgi:hypothetical protein